MERTEKFVVLHVNGIHSINIYECGCMKEEQAKPEGSLPQARFHLLRLGIWPMTQLLPRSGVTMQALKTFHAVTLQAQVSAYDYHEVLRRLTCNEIKEDAPVSFTLWH